MTAPTHGDSLSLLEEKWKSGFGLHIDGIVFATGRIVLCNCVKVKRDGRTFPVASPIGDSTLDSVLSYDDDPWVDLTEMDRKEYVDSNIKVSCGEGAMGNEGYVAVSSLEDGGLKWLAFFSCSNPFESVRLENGNVVAENTYEQLWTFPLERPEAMTLVSME